MRRWLLPFFLLVLLSLPVSAALAHGGEKEPKDAVTLVRQAVAALQNGGNIDLASDKVKDALEAEDKAGVNLKLVEEAQAALQGNDLAKATALLQQSLTPAPPAAAQGEGAGEQAGEKMPAGPAGGPASAMAVSLVDGQLEPNFQGTPVEYALLVFAGLVILLGGLIVARA